jgi:hypothetical protein
MGNSFFFVHATRTYRCWAEMNDTSTAPSPAAHSNACWLCEVGGKHYRLFEAFHNDRETPAKCAELELRIIAEVQRQDSQAKS